MTVTADLRVRPGQMYIDGEWTAGSAGTSLVLDPATEKVVGEVGEGSVRDAAGAAAAARSAQPRWWRMAPADRAVVLARVAEGIRAGADEIARLSMLESGFTAAYAHGNVARAAEWFDLAARETMTDHDIPTPPNLSRTHDGAPGDLVSGLIQRRPVGVVAVLVPFNGPVYGVAMKSAQALAMGNAVVVKPAQQNPLEICALFEVFQQAGFPPGVVNLVLGHDNEVPAELTRSVDVDMVTFTGSTSVGKRVYESGARTLKRMVLELGGKNACIVTGDADLDKAMKGLTHPWNINSGQICSAPTRALVHRSVHDELMGRLADYSASLRVGSPFDPDTVLGPVITGEQRGRIEGFVRSALDEGGELLAGGSRPDFDAGFYVAPTLIAGCHNDMTAVRNEIFGPVITAICFDDEDEAVAIANDTEYGLANYVYTEDRAKGFWLAGQLDSGTVQVNTTAIKLDMPRGGRKLSGIGREGGAEGLHLFTEMASVVWA